MEKVPCDPQIGADVEAFVFCEPNKSYVPCVGILPGTKDNPYPLKDLPDGYAVQEDNVMAEFNIPPVQSEHAFAHAINHAIGGVKKMLPPDHVLRFEPSVLFRPKDLMSEQARTIGCQPDYNAYDGGSIRANLPRLGLHRGAGGHIHLGGDFQCPDWVAALFAEAFISVPTFMLPKSSDYRAKWYGKPGVFRPKPYGIEYRTPSCQWAGDFSMTCSVGEMALRCARWLTNEDAVTIQSVFRRIKWKEMFDLMQTNQEEKGAINKRDKFMSHLIDSGLPL